jgi:hypothetical protein
MHTMHLLPSVAIRPNLELKTQPKQLLGSLPLVIALSTLTPWCTELVCLALATRCTNLVCLALATYLKVNIQSFLLYFFQMVSSCLPIPKNSKSSVLDCVDFTPFDDVSSLPFPLNSHPLFQLIYMTALVFALVEGTRLRQKIIAFLNSSESNIGPINFLIWLDQEN